MSTDIDALIASAISSGIRGLSLKLASDKEHARVRPSTTLREWSEGEVLISSKVLDKILSAHNLESANEDIVTRIQALLDSSGERLRAKLVVDPKTHRFMVIV